MTKNTKSNTVTVAPPAPIIRISDAVYQKVMYWVNKADFEVSGFGKVVQKGPLDFEVVDAYLIKQVGSAAETDIDQTALAALAYHTKDEPGELRWWWHSHVQMPVFWSGTDTKTIKDLGSNGWIIATVFNQKSEHRSALCYRTESQFGVATQLIDEIELEVESFLDAELTKKWDDEFTSKVTERTYGHMYPSLFDDGWVGDKAWDTGVRTPNVPPSKSKPGKNDMDDATIEEMLDDPGLLGYGILAESKALGMTPRTYYHKLYESVQHNLLSKYEDKLTRLESKGKFDGMLKFTEYT